MGVTRIWCNFRLVLEGKIGKEIPESRFTLVICQKFQQPSFREMMNSFVLLAHASSAASGTLLQRFCLSELLACLIYSVGTNDFYEL